MASVEVFSEAGSNTPIRSGCLRRWAGSTDSWSVGRQSLWEPAGTWARSVSLFIRSSVERVSPSGCSTFCSAGFPIFLRSGASTWPTSREKNPSFGRSSSDMVSRMFFSIGRNTAAPHAGQTGLNQNQSGIRDDPAFLFIKHRLNESVFYLLPPRIELGSWASEAHILSVELRERTLCQSVYAIPEMMEWQL